MKSFNFSLAIIIFCCVYKSLTNYVESSVHFLEAGEVFENRQPGLQIFCHNAKSKYLVNVWKSLILHLRTNLDTYEIYDGKTPAEVKEKHEYNQKSWKFNFFDVKKNKMFKIDPFQDVCIGIYTHRLNQYHYEVSLTQISIDNTKVFFMALGMLLFWYSQQLSKNTIFYYLCGVMLGVTTSVIILIYFISKLLPKGKFMYLTAAAGYTMSLYLLQILWENAQLILKQYKEWVFYYIIATSLISFVICYRFGPVTNERTIKIIQWFLQALGLVSIYCSSYFVEASSAFCIVLIMVYNFPSLLFSRGKVYWRRIFPERRKLLTDDQYREQGIRETSLALDGLKDYCSSPECNPWKLVLKLKDPIRFAQFIEGNSQFLDDEAQAHDIEITTLIEENEFTDDEDFDY